MSQETAAKVISAISISVWYLANYKFRELLNFALTRKISIREIKAAMNSGIDLKVPSSFIRDDLDELE